MNKDKI